MYDGFARVVVGFDGSTDARHALTWGVDAARRRRAPLQVLVATGGTLYGGESPLSVPGDKMARSWVRQAKEMLADSPLTDYTVSMDSGLPPVVLVRASGPSVLTVVGSHGHGRFAEMLIGSVSQHVARHASGPVVVVRGQADSHARRIVVGIDGSTTSAHALEFACAEATSTGQPVTALYGWRPVDVRRRTLADEGVPVGPSGPDQLERWMSEALAGMREKFPDVALDAEAFGAPAPRILVDASATADLVVVGSRGRGAFPELLLGSVAQAVLQNAQCPVAVVR